MFFCIFKPFPGFNKRLGDRPIPDILDNMQEQFSPLKWFERCPSCLTQNPLTSFAGLRSNGTSVRCQYFSVKAGRKQECIPVGCVPAAH